VINRNEVLEEAAAIVDHWANARPDELRLKGGEMTAQEVRTVRAFLKAAASDIRSKRSN